MNIKIIASLFFALLVTSTFMYRSETLEQKKIETNNQEKNNTEKLVDGKTEVIGETTKSPEDKNKSVVSKPTSSTSTTSPSLKFDEENLKPILVASEWIWIKTELSTRPVTDLNLIIQPNSKGDFVIKFSNDGKVSIKTDCNNMGGAYKFSENKITFGSMISTMMFCEGSKENEFSKMLRQEKVHHLSFSDENTKMYLTSDQTIYFEKK